MVSPTPFTTLSLHSLVNTTHCMPDTGMIVHQNADTLNRADRDLLKRAAENQKLAYAPYSEFLVGAALRTKEGEIVDGANQENASYPLCMCGERVALYNCAVQYPGQEIETIAIVVHGTKPMPAPAPPCGACLQVIREFEYRQSDKPIRILLKADSDTVWEVPSVKTMLPYAFDGSFL